MSQDQMLPEVKSSTLVDVLMVTQSLAKVCEHSEVNLTVSDQIDLIISMESDSFVKGKIKKPKHLQIVAQWVPYDAGEYRPSTMGALSFIDAKTEKVLPYDRLDRIIEILSQIAAEVPEELIAMSEAQQKVLTKEQGSNE